MKFGFNAEPALIAAAIRSVLLLGALFYMELTPDRIAAIMVTVEAILALITRSVVTTQNTLEAAGTSQKEIVAKATANANQP